MPISSREADSEIPDSPQPPYPIVSDYCDIICGFGRGSAELGIPTANVPVKNLPTNLSNLPLGIYFGFSKIRAVHKETDTILRSDGTQVEFNYGKFLERAKGDLEVLPVVLSIGKNPFYGNDFNTIELHIIHRFQKNFYGAQVKFSVLGYIRPELDYTTKEALIKDINIDIAKALDALAKDGYKSLAPQLED